MQVRFGDFTLDAHERTLAGPAGTIELGSRSFDLLTVFLRQPDQLLDKATLFDAVWPGVVVEENTLQVHMSALRKALGSGYIATVHGRGYKYVGPPPQQGEAVAAPPATTGNIARYRSDCVARDSEIAALARLLGQHRLVSVLGPGGVGKTTLAVAVADTLPLPDGGVWMVDLASLGDGQFIESTLIQTLGVPFRAGAAALDSIVQHLRGSGAVLVFDNCEHVREAAARTIRVLLDEVPDLRVLATSQVPLGLPQEHVFKLLPFAVGDADEAGPAASRFLQYCYESFGETLSPQELPLVARLVRRLDGVALAIKMAAARAATVGIETVDRQLEQQLATLEADWDPTLARHRSLVASLAWSYDLLAAGHQRTLRALGVFHGSFSIAAATAVAGDGAEASVAELVRRSLVVRGSEDRSRYRLLDATRQFALDRLADAGEDAAARQRHAAWIAGHFGAGIALWEELPDGDWDRLYRPDGDNLRAALAWARAQGDWALYVEIAAASYRYFVEEQLGTEGLETIEAGVAHLGHLPPASAARLQLALGELCRQNAMDIRGREVLTRALVYFRGADDPLRYRLTLTLLTAVTIFFRSIEEARPLIAELEALLPDMPHSKVKAWGLAVLGTLAWVEGDAVAGPARIEAGLAMHVACGNPNGRSRSAVNLCEMLHKQGETARAIEIGERLLPEMRRDGSKLHLCLMLTNVAAYHLSLGQAEAAEAPLLEAAVVIPRDGGHWHWCILQGMAELRASRGAASEAAILAGFTDRCFEGWPDGRQETEELQRRRLQALLGAALPEAEFARLLQQGRTLSLFEADHLAGFSAGGRAALGG